MYIYIYIYMYYPMLAAPRPAGRRWKALRDSRYIIYICITYIYIYIYRERER